MIRCIAIDDEPLALQQMVIYIEKTPFLEVVGSFDNALSALEFLQNEQVDLMYVDINMPDLSGVDLVKSLTQPPKVIFTTAYRDYALEGFKLDAADYLLKPISYADFLTASEKTRLRYFAEAEGTQQIQTNDEFLFIKSEYKIVKIAYKDILYIEGMREYVRIFIKDSKAVMTLMSMKKMEEHLPTNHFMRVHRSYIVNLDMVTTIERMRIVFDKVYIPISDQYKEAFQKFIDHSFLK